MFEALAREFPVSIVFTLLRYADPEQRGRG
jgi:hypothetical protein